MTKEYERIREKLKHLHLLPDFYFEGGAISLSDEAINQILNDPAVAQYFCAGFVKVIKEK